MKEEGNSTAKKTKTKTGGQHTRLEKGTRTPSDFHSAEPRAEPVRQRGQSTEAGKSQAQGRGCWRRQPALTQLKQATPSTTSSMKKSCWQPGRAALRDGLCHQQKPPLAEKARAWQGEGQGQSPVASCRPGPGSPGSPRSPRTLPRSQVGGKGPGGTGREETERERGGVQIHFPPSLPLPGEVGCPPSPRCSAG